ncbi:MULTISPECIES: type I phosphomannose isomerase catalytic subunit [Ruminococcus]|jgi:phosphomannose isomerase type I|uniref:type I phosphomannose isomerase catalytic subunit n=1 Tax=Ruminococcus TaxID=1263 RepID=UPI000E4482FA|nr:MULTISPECIES: type I phosphomannose isomerase catalytic subunit [Ruminococcus]MBS6580310.1 class I mannose-6-phosphate isomerase [Clostridiales bacterium]MBS6768288.1 class I mannose-6-phosphate isomerase [Clostridium sp.]RGM77610.1 class I mannose-6-phosphate isomerase [Ruminococcus sp. OM06-36AC]
MSIDPIVKLSPAFKDYLWGGTKLRDIYHKPCDFDIIAESWELSAHPDGTSIVAGGQCEGMLFTEYLEKIGLSALGTKYDANKDFPLLIKLIDAKQNLSVQVHPDDTYALRHENGYGKTEMWYVIDTEPGAGLYVGFNRDVSREEVAQRIKDNTVMEVLDFHPTKPGDVFFIPAGTVHAIGAGNLICEIQQSSNSTYRLYDYDRRDKFGNPRELHLEKALDVLNYRKYEPKSFDGKVSCKYFNVSFVDVQEQQQIPLSDDSFYSITCIKGSGTLMLGEAMPINSGETVFIPATDAIMSVEGNVSLVITKM